MNHSDYIISRGIAKNYKIENYDKIYYQTNEDLVHMYKKVDFNDKKVLTILGSSDQLFTARFLGAKDVESFDKNILTKYYYYLKMWSIKYRKCLYPNIFDKRWMYDLLKKVKPLNEEEKIAKIFFVRHLTDNTRLSSLFYNIDMQPEGSTIYKNGSELLEYTNDKLIFYNYDLFKDNNFQKKYDILIISNILDWARNDIQKLKKAKENIDKLLNDNAIVLCSTFYPFEKNIEKDLFSSYQYKSYHNNLNYSYRK